MVDPGRVRALLDRLKEETVKLKGLGEVPRDDLLFLSEIRLRADGARPLVTGL